MIRLALTFLRAGGLTRPLLLGAGTAAATALLLVAVAMLRLPERPDEALFDLVYEPGLRGGTAFGTALLVAPVLLMLYQVVRFGTASRERRLATLRLAGATPGEVRAIGAIEVGIPATVGAVAGLIGYAVLRLLVGGEPIDGAGPSQRPVHLVPTTVAPTWWQFVLVVAGVAAAGVVIGWRASRHLAASPLGVSRRQPAPPPRPWGLVPVGVAAVTGPVAATLLDHAASTALLIVTIVLVVVGIVALAPWSAYLVARRAVRRTGSPVTLLAARHLLSEPRPAGRAAAAVGAIALVSGAAGAIEADVFLGSGSRGFDPFFVGSFALVGAALLVALAVATCTLAVHAAESLLDRRRPLAALAAAGTPVDTLYRALAREAGLATMPMAAAGALLGAGPLIWIATSPASLAVVLAQVALTLLLVRVAVRISTATVRPWLVRTCAATNLRTE